MIALIVLCCVAGNGITGCLAAARTPAASIHAIASYRDIPSVTGEEIAAIEALKSARRSFSFASPATTEAFISPDGAHAGFAPLFCALLSDLFGIPFVQQIIPQESLQDQIHGKLVDFTNGLTPTPDRRQTYFMSHPIAARSLGVFTYGNAVAIETEDDLNGLRIGFLADAATDKSMLHAYPALTFAATYMRDIPGAIAMLESGAVDAVVADATHALHFSVNPLIRCKEMLPQAYIPVVLATANQEFAPLISVVDKYITAGGINKLHELYTQGHQEYAQYAFKKSLTTEEKAYLDALAANNGKICIALETSNYPISFYNKHSKEFQGIANDILKRVSVLAGIEFVVTTGIDTPWVEILEKLKADEVSLISELLSSKERKEHYLLTDVPYSTTRLALLSKYDFPNIEIHQLAWATVGFVKGSIYETMYNEFFPDNDNTKYYDTSSDAMDALERGEIDLLMSSENFLLALRNYREKLGYKANIIFDTRVESFFGLNKNEQVLHSIICKAQAQINTGKITKKWQNRVYDYSKKLTHERLLYLSVSAAILLLLFGALIRLYIKSLRVKELHKNQTITLSTMYDSLPDIIVCKNLNGVYTSWNSAFEKFVGLRASEIAGKTAREIYARSENSASSVTAIDNKVLHTNSTIRVEEYLTFPDGTRRLFETIKSPLLEDGKKIGVLGISRDIMEYKLAMDAAQEASRAKSAFLAHISHEIRTPMNMMLGMNELILQEAATKKVYEYALLVKQAGTNLLAIINDVLDFSKIEAGKLEIHLNEYIFASLINDIINIIRSRINVKPVLFTVNIAGNLPNKLVGDEIRIKEIFLNLLSNAAKYTHDGFISVNVKSDVDIDHNTAIMNIDIVDSGIGIKNESINNIFGQFVRIDSDKTKSIEGTGLGLPITKNLCLAMGGNISVKSEYGAGSVFTVTIPQQFDIYEKFASVENPEQKSVLLYEPRSVYADSLIRTFADLGVRCSHVASMQNFHAELEKEQFSFIFISSFLFESESRLDAHQPTAKLVLITEFGKAYSAKNAQTVTMPVHSLTVANILNEKTDDAISYYGSHPLTGAFTAASAKILIVDDFDTNLIVAEGLMRPYKMHIDTCKSGMEAIDLVSRNQYDLIFMDHAMPEMDGIEATCAIRSLEGDSAYYKNVPIVALTANVVSGMKEIFLQNGMNDYLAKPIEIAKLNNILKKWIPAEKQEPATDVPDESDVDEPSTLVIEGIDVQIGLSLNGGVMDNYLRALDVFRKDGFEKIESLSDCLKKNDFARYVTLVHGLKSASMSIGAKELSDLAKNLEAAGKHDSPAFILKHNESFLAKLGKLLHNIDDAIAHTEKAQLGVSDLEFLKQSFDELKNALKNMKPMQTNEILKKLAAKTWDKKHKDIIDELSRLILVFEYDKAISLIDDSLR